MNSKYYTKEIKLKDNRILIVKEAGEDDAKKLIKYISRVGGESDFLTFSGGEYIMTVEEEKRFIKSCRESENQILLIGWLENDIAGCLTFRSGKWQKVSHTGELGITVSKKNWGMGIGTIIMNHFLDWAKNTKVIRKINLRVRSDNDRAIAVYKKLGFVKEGVITREFLIKGKFYDNITMGLIIN